MFWAMCFDPEKNTGHCGSPFNYIYMPISIFLVYTQK